ncbi:hypothetical protein KQ940_22475 [Marinobacterium sp. D7]|nr:hypothetical protein [Marinobacterium ramblicola]MBV1790837.1 hypothetical protein [Marinobacterium ramblicola]
MGDPIIRLNGRTPAEVWCGRDIFKTGYRKAYFYTAWEGLLRGYYLPP